MALATTELFERLESFICQSAGNNLNAVKMPGRIMPWEIDGDIVGSMEDMIEKLPELDKIAIDEYGMNVSQIYFKNLLKLKSNPESNPTA